MCECIKEVNNHLSQYNTRILIPMIGPQRPFVETEKVSERVRGKPKRMFASFCPFCGEKFDREKTDNHVSPELDQAISDELANPPKSIMTEG
jgi:hypothetical protein